MPGTAGRARARPAPRAGGRARGTSGASPRRSSAPPSTAPVTCSSCSPASALELAPELIGAPDEGHVRRVLEVGEPDDPRDPVRGAELVRDVEPLDTEHALPAAREVIQRRAPHPADSDDDDVVALHPA